MMGSHTPVNRLRAYADGLLPPRERAETAVHLASCPECRADLEWLRGVAVELQGTLGPAAPERDLWPGIAIRIREGASSIGSKHIAIPARPLLAAAAVAGLLISGGITLSLLRSQAPPPGASASSRESPGTLPLLFVEAEREYIQTTDALQSLLEGQHEHLPPSVRQEVVENLAMLDRTIHEARGELAANPDDFELMLSITMTYKHKMNVLQDAIHLSASD